MRVCTVKDVAKKAGVSAMTVSRVLNQTGSVSEATRRKVLDAASELHYYGNSVARSLRVNETKTIGVVLSDSSEMVLSTVLRSIHDVVGLQGYTVITANTDRRKEMERFAIETLMRKHIDGLILVAPLCFDRETTDWLKSLAIPSACVPLSLLLAVATRTSTAMKAVSPIPRNGFRIASMWWATRPMPTVILLSRHHP